MLGQDMLCKAQIKCCNIDHGVYLLDDIRERLNVRILKGSIGVIESITSDGLTWITVAVKFNRADYADSLVVGVVDYIKGLVSGILIWSGVEVV